MCHQKYTEKTHWDIVYVSLEAKKCFEENSSEEQKLVQQLFWLMAAPIIARHTITNAR